MTGPVFKNPENHKRKTLVWEKEKKIKFFRKVLNFHETNNDPKIWNKFVQLNFDQKFGRALILILIHYLWGYAMRHKFMGYIYSMMWHENDIWEGYMRIVIRSPYIPNIFLPRTDPPQTWTDPPQPGPPPLSKKSAVLTFEQK